MDYIQKDDYCPKDSSINIDDTNCSVSCPHFAGLSENGVLCNCKDDRVAEYNPIAKIDAIERGCVETSHKEADEIICKTLELLGEDDIVRAYRKISKWYS